MHGFQFQLSLKQWPAQKASGQERHPFDSVEPMITHLYQIIQNLDVLLIGSLEMSNVSKAMILFQSK